MIDGFRYSIDAERLPARLRPVVRQFGPDAGLAAYLEVARRRRLGALGTAVHRALRLYVGEYDVNAWLGAYPMHLASRSQWEYLVGEGPSGRLLDVGAGDGSVTESLSPLFEGVETTEISKGMARRLEARGYACHRGDVCVAGLPSGAWRAISLLNVLDRASHPLLLLKTCAAALKRGSLLVIALALPYSPASYSGAYVVEPAETLDLAPGDWESQAAGFVERVLEPLGLVVTALSRLPYLTGGDAFAPLAWFDDLIVVVRRVEGPA